MAVYKPSNLSPSLEEIDITEMNTFSAQANTSGESIKAYKFSILNNNSDTTVYESAIRNLSSTAYVKNKAFLDIENVSSALNANLVNGKDYQWSVRMYDAVSGSTAQPITKVCDGFLVGSTSYVLWTNDNDQILYDRYVQIDAGTSSMFPIIGSNPDNLVLKQDTVRRKIDWVESGLGQSENITKIELTEPFTFNYINGTTGAIYLCDNQHTLNSIYANPNDGITNGVYIVTFSSESYATTTLNGTWTPANGTKPSGCIETARQIIGYSSTTGEIRVQEPFSAVPVDGQFYILYTYDRSSKTYTAVENQDVSTQKIGGTSQYTFTILQNVWNSTTKRLFIQPNINIKTDDTNPPEIVFENGVRVDIKKQTAVINSKTVDITFDKLDNTQWMLTYNLAAIDQNGTAVSSIQVTPGTPYTVYTDFMDNMPNGVFYARKTPTLTLQYKNLNTAEALEDIDPDAIKEWRDIRFSAIWDSANRTQVKYYQYTLYDAAKTIISQGDPTYDSELTWWFRGFETSLNETTPVKYTIELNVVDELGKSFTQTSDFQILYKTDQGVTPLEVTFECEEQAIRVLASAPTYAESTDKDGEPTVTEEDLALDGDDYVSIPVGKVLNYTNLTSSSREPIQITPNFTFLTQFRITADFVKQIAANSTRTVLEVAHQNAEGTYDKYTLKLSSFQTFYLNAATNTIASSYDRYKLRWYLNDGWTPLSIIGESNANEFDISTNIEGEFVSPSLINIPLQDASTFTIVEALPTRGTFGMKYLLTNDYVLNGVTYYQGVYQFTGGTWQIYTLAEYYWIDDMSQVPYYTYDMLNAPTNTQTEDGTGIEWADEGNVWIDDNGLILENNLRILEQNWFRVYLTIINDDSGTPVVNSIIEVSTERK